jgi:hypothetical protein
MHPIKAFVGHSFAEEDEGVVTAILNILRRVTELHRSFVWEDAAHPEPKGVDAKVLQLGLPISSIAAYRKSEEKGETLAMSNIAAKLVDAGFLPEAEKILKSALAVEDHHKNVDSGLASAKSAAESEGEEESKIFGGAKAVSDFYRAFGRAFVKPLGGDISGRWNIPQWACRSR